MASTRERFTKEGQRYYEIRVRRGREKSEVTTRWYPPEGKAASTIKRLLEKAANDFEREVSEGKILSAHEQKEADKKRAAAEAAERARIQTVAQYADLFMKKVELKNSENTRTNYRCLLDRHIIPAIGSIPVQDVTSADIDSLMTDMLSKGYALTTRQRVWTVLNMVFKQARKTKLIRSNPMDDIEDERPTATKADKAAVEARREQFYTADEVQCLLHAVDSEPLKWRVFVYLLALSGIRRGEACALKWSDIDFGKREIKISKSLNYTGSAGVYCSDTKSGKSRIISLGDEDPVTKAIYDRFFSMLEELRESQKQDNKAKAKKTDADSKEQTGKVIRLDAMKDSWVFQQEGNTEPMHPTSPTAYFAKFGKKHGFENFHPHLLRHSFVSIAIAEGQDVVAVSRSAGHSDARITLSVYAHASTEGVRKVTGAVGKAISSVTDGKDAAEGEK